MFLVIFRKVVVLFFCFLFSGYGQTIDNLSSIELGATTFPIERPFTISLIIPNSETRATVAFPDINGFVKRGTSTSVTPIEVGGKTLTSQIITQNYQAKAPGRFRLAPFVIVINGETVRSEGAALVVQPSASLSVPGSATLSTVELVPEGAAFLSLRASRQTIYTGEEVGLTLSFFVADNYPYELSFQSLDKQLQAIVKKIRPANSWEENVPINDLTPIPVSIRKKKFREYRIFQSVFFPLSNQSIRLPAVSLQVNRRPVIGPPASQPETAVFTSRPLAIGVKALPIHPLRGRVPVGTFRLEEALERQYVVAGKSVRYTFSISGKGNIATLPAPGLLAGQSEIDVFPPEARHTITHGGNEVTGRKTFTYYIVPHQNGLVSLANYVQWVYFDPQRALYDTLRPQLQLQVGGNGAGVLTNTNIASSSVVTNGETVPGAPVVNSIYAGVEGMDSTRQPVSIPVLIRSMANVLILVMLLGMVFVLVRK
ncbi:BatD family protein [Spirosoma lituiforme]